MPAEVTLNLSAKDLFALQEVHRFDDNWRARERAETLALLHSGLSASEVAVQTGLHFRTVLSRPCKTLGPRMNAHFLV